MSRAIRHEFYEIWISETIFQFEVSPDIDDIIRLPPKLTNRIKMVNLNLWGVPIEGLRRDGPKSWLLDAFCKFTLGPLTGALIERKSLEVGLGWSQTPYKMNVVLSSPVVETLKAMTGFRTVLFQFSIQKQPVAPFSNGLSQDIKNALEPTLGPATERYCRSRYCRYRTEVIFHPREYWMKTKS